MFLPINGRVAIIDNEIGEVEPLFRIFSKNRIPYLFVKGDDMNYLPEEDDESNDIRLLFLDLNLLGNRTPEPKEVKSSLFPILKRVISKNNFPYSIILWSKQEDKYTEALKELFDESLSDRKPITIENFIKSDFFDLDGNVLEDSGKNIIEEIREILLKHQAYSTLVYWENKVHKSADNVLQTIFNAYEDENWVNKTNFIISKLGEAYLGFSNYKSSNYIEKTKGSLQAFNNIFYDSLESDINLISHIKEQAFILFDEQTLEKEKLLDIINFKLLASTTELDLDYTGTVSEDINLNSNKIFETILNDSFDRFSIISEITGFDTFDSKKQNSELKNVSSAKRKKIREEWNKIYLVVTPLCDKVQNKHRKIRAVKGFIIDKEYKKYIDDKSEAIYISPSFYCEKTNKSKIIILNFRYFFTYPTDKKLLESLKYINPIFRLRSSVISEIQSKLARHVSRQGVLYTE
ncbi:hypothetical protein ACRASX_14955 [Flavobacterium sp. TMP13]|uniref:hypothetical protein n=1 Tax=Flavobacterium sp. TMP13 TaxID=3425950 RepID=UPI003D76AB46